MGAMRTTYINRAIQFTMWIILLIYPPISRRAIEYFNCSEPIDGTHYMTKDFRITCFEGKWSTYLPFGILAVAVYPLGIPAYFAHGLYKRRKHLDDRNVLNRFGFLYAIYRRETYLWDVWEMLQKLFLTGIIALIFPGRDLQVVVVVLADLGFLCVLLIMKPHTHGPLRNLALAASVAITLTMYCGLVLRTVDGVASNVKYRTAIDIFLVTMNGSVACYALKHIIPFALLYGLCKKKEKKKAKARIFRGSNASVKQIKKKKDSSDKIVRSLTSPSQGTNVMQVKESNMLKGNRTKIAPSSSGFSFFKVLKEAQEKAEKNVTNDTEKMNNKVPSKDFSVKNNTNAIAESNNKEKSGSSSSPSSISQFSRSARDFSFFKDFKEAQKQAEKNVTNSTTKMNNEVPSNDFSVKNNTNSIAGSIKNDDIKLILGEFTDTLLEYQNNLLERTNTGKTILIIASQMGKIELVKTFLLFRATDINSRSNNGCTALWYAVKNRNNDVVKYLLESGADPNIRDKMGSTPILIASQFGCNESLQALI